MFHKPGYILISDPSPLEKEKGSVEGAAKHRNQYKFRLLVVSKLPVQDHAGLRPGRLKARPVEGQASKLPVQDQAVEGQASKWPVQDQAG